MRKRYSNKFDLIFALLIYLFFQIFPSEFLSKWFSMFPCQGSVFFGFCSKKHSLNCFRTLPAIFFTSSNKNLFRFTLADSLFNILSEMFLTSLS